MIKVVNKQPEQDNIPYITPRRRIMEILDSAAKSKLVYVIAGAGYGKTQAVRNYVEQQENAVVRWVQLTESDNIGSRYWEHLTYNISHDNPELSERLREFGFPDTSARFKKFAEILKTTEHRSLKTFLVLDDFHLINSKQALRFAERCAHLSIPGACVVIISRTEPEINTVSLFAKGQASIITEDQLRFTGDEISQFFTYKGIALTADKLALLTQATGGWAIAVSLISMVLARKPKDFTAAVDVMKQNVFKLMETEAFLDFPEKIRKNLIRHSLVPDIPLEVLWEHFGDTPLAETLPRLASFIWIDSFTGQDRVHPLYREFLESKRDLLTEDQQLETYKLAAGWCKDNNLLIDAMKYLASSRQFGRMVEILLSYPIKLPRDMCQYYLGIIESIKPLKSERNDSSYLLLINLFTPLLLLGAGEYEKARDRCTETIRKWKRTAGPLAAYMLSIAYSNLTYIDMYTCTVTHAYNAPEHLRKSLEYQMKSSVPPLEIGGAFAVADVRSFACLVGEGAKFEEFDGFLNMAKETCRYIIATSHNMYYGYDDLTSCELAYYQNKPESAKIFANDAIMKAREKKQYSIEAMAAMYLFRIALSEGDYPLVKELFRQRHDSPEMPYFWNRQFLYELGISFIYAMIGQPGMMPAWLSSEDRDAQPETGVPVRELICSARFHIASKKYELALLMLSGAHPRAPAERFQLGELELTLLTAAARAGTGDLSGAARDFEKAYTLSYNGVFEMPFIELGKDFLSLADAVSENHTGIIPDGWLKTMSRKASVYVKKSTVVLSSFKKEKHIEDTVHLSRRERDVLEDLYHGLSREEIAVSRYLSVNTVHKIIQSLFLKLDAYNKADAVMKAVEKKILD